MNKKYPTAKQAEKILTIYRGRKPTLAGYLFLDLHDIKGAVERTERDPTARLWALKPEHIAKFKKAWKEVMGDEI